MIERERETHTHRDRKRDKESERDRQTDRQTNRQTDRGRDREKQHIHRSCWKVWSSTGAVWEKLYSIPSRGRSLAMSLQTSSFSICINTAF